MSLYYKLVLIVLLSMFSSLRAVSPRRLAGRDVVEGTPDQTPILHVQLPFDDCQRWLTITMSTATGRLYVDGLGKPQHVHKPVKASIFFGEHCDMTVGKEMKGLRLSRTAGQKGFAIELKGLSYSAQQNGFVLPLISKHTGYVAKNFYIQTFDALKDGNLQNQKDYRTGLEVSRLFVDRLALQTKPVSSFMSIKVNAGATFPFLIGEVKFTGEFGVDSGGLKQAFINLLIDSFATNVTVNGFIHPGTTHEGMMAYGEAIGLAMLAHGQTRPSNGYKYSCPLTETHLNRIYMTAALFLNVDISDLSDETFDLLLTNDLISNWKQNSGVFEKDPNVKRFLDLRGDVDTLDSFVSEDLAGFKTEFGADELMALREKLGMHEKDNSNYMTAMARYIYGEHFQQFAGVLRGYIRQMGIAFIHPHNIYAFRESFYKKEIDVDALIAKIGLLSSWTLSHPWGVKERYLLDKLPLYREWLVGWITENMGNPQRIKQLLIFWTAQDSEIPHANRNDGIIALRYSEGKEKQRWPEANTCFHRLTIYACDETATDFVQKLNRALEYADGFGNG